ncbi:MAG: efflux RND transporter periplasmic adaptor subunit [Caldilineaceae bacterium]|nr:efflux RND transporter periplasmic adaptor subunit [Caldilineaceae bacterium]
MRRFIVTLIVLALLGAAGWYGYQRYQAAQAAAAAIPAYETVPIERGSINSTVSATGSIDPEAQVSLSFRGAGRVDQVLVTVGQAVEAGQLLAQLDVTDASLAVEQSDIALQISRAQLAKMENPPSDNDIAGAQAAVTVAQASVASGEASLASAQASYRQLLAGASAAERAVQESQIRQAEANVRQAQQAYDQVRNSPNVGALPQAAQLEQATIAYEVAQSQYAVSQAGANEAQVASSLAQIAQAELSVRQARSNLLTAQNSLEKLLEGPDAEDLEIARAQVRQAELSRKQAENTLNNSRLSAPISGIISQVNIRQGELYGSSALPAVVLTDLNSFHMTVLVDEIDVRQVQVGQTVRLSLDALPDADISGSVTSVSPTARDVGGVVAYEVEIVPDPTDAPLRAGMSATAIITTAQVDNVLLVPNRYIQLDRESGRAFVQKLVGDVPTLQEIDMGLRNDRFTQVLAGLSDGDAIALIRVSSQDQLRGALFGGN